MIVTILHTISDPHTIDSQMAVKAIVDNLVHNHLDIVEIEILRSRHAFLPDHRQRNRTPKNLLVLKGNKLLVACPEL